METWDRQFHCAPKGQWVSFLYLANDILQNSRRKGLEFVNEFWKVLPDALNNVMENGDEFGRSAAVRLVRISISVLSKTCKSLMYVSRQCICIGGSLSWLSWLRWFFILFLECYISLGFSSLSVASDIHPSWRTKYFYGHVSLRECYWMSVC